MRIWKWQIATWLAVVVAFACSRLAAQTVEPTVFAMRGIAGGWEIPQLGVTPGQCVDNIVRSSDGRFVYSTTEGMKTIEIFEADSAGQLNLIQQFDSGYFDEGCVLVGSQVNCFSGIGRLAMSPDERHIYIGDFNGMVVLNRGADDGLLSVSGIVPGSGIEFGFTRSPIFTRDGMFALTPDASTFSVFQRDLISGMLTRTQIVEQPPEVGYCAGGDLALSADNQYVYWSCIYDGSILLYQRDAITGDFSYVERIERYGENLGEVYRGVASPDGQFYISFEHEAGDRENSRLTTLRRDLVSGSLSYQSSILIPVARNYHSEFSPDGKMFLSGGGVYNYSADTGELSYLATLDDPCLGTPSMCWSTFSADGNLVLAGPIRRSGENLTAPTAVYRSGYRVQCSENPRTGCTPADAGAITINAPDEQNKRSIKVVFEAQSATLADLGDPQGTTDYAVCAYDNTFGRQQLRWTATLPGGLVQCSPTAWYSSPTQYSMKLRGEYTPEGVAKANFKQKNGRLRMSVKGKGRFIRARSVPGAGSVNLVAQLISSEGNCWDVIYQEQDVLKSDGTRYMARRR